MQGFALKYTLSRFQLLMQYREKSSSPHADRAPGNDGKMHPANYVHVARHCYTR